jgi:hypothetical protein
MTFSMTAILIVVLLRDVSDCSGAILRMLSASMPLYNLSRPCCTAIETAQNRDFTPGIASWTILAWPPAN